MLWPLMHNWQWLELRYVYVFVQSSVFVHLGMELGSCEQCPVDPLVVDDFAEKSRVEANGSCKGLATGFFVPLKRQINQGCQPPTPRIQYVKYQVFSLVAMIQLEVGATQRKIECPQNQMGWRVEVRSVCKAGGSTHLTQTWQLSNEASIMKMLACEFVVLVFSGSKLMYHTAISREWVKAVNGSRFKALPN